MPDDLRPAPADAAGELLRRCLDSPDDAGAWLALGLGLSRQGDQSGADEAFAEAAALAGDPLTAALQRVQAASASGQAEAELGRLKICTEADPLCAQAWTAQAWALERLGRRPEAIDALEIATTLAPRELRAAKMLGMLLARSSRLREAEAALRAARALDDTDGLIINDHAVVLMRLYRFSEARDVLGAALAGSDARLQALCNLPGATVVLGLQDEAATLARQAVAEAPESMQARRALCNVLPYCDGVTAHELSQALHDCAERMPRGGAARWLNAPDPSRRLRVGLLSGSLREHPVGWLTVAGFEALDPSAFELIVLAQAECDDPVARRFRAVAAQWHGVDRMSDPELCTFARNLGVDVLIELGGHGENARLPACALRLAPVQVKWVGMQYHGTGMAEMDWIITDAVETPPHLAPLYAERLLTLPDGYVCYSPPPDAPDVGPLPAASRGAMTFGCFNNLAKVTPRVIQTWARVIRGTPGARLVLKTQALADAQVRDRITAAFASHGVAADRLDLRGGSAHRAFMAEYGDVDIVLDPFPYSGGLSTCEALWMGVPVVALPGETFAARHSASHLSNVGLCDWIADDADGYVELAAARAADLPALARMRRGLRARVKASPLCDAPRFGRNLGAALCHAWACWCSGAAA